MAVTWEREDLTTNWVEACQNYSKENKRPRELRERSPHRVVLSMPCWHITNWLVPRELGTDFHILLVPPCLWDSVGWPRLAEEPCLLPLELPYSSSLASPASWHPPNVSSLFLENLTQGRYLAARGPTSALFRWNKHQETEHQTLTQGLPWSRAH